ncbi:ABC transporter substrate-binding protein/permease [Luteipulveratus flavus]|uniref:ABC transporter substrate-binding protein/permease n=1 Tax=Luteipulveratus flavus TaxID=3031728 RepID=UPI00319DDE71
MDLGAARRRTAAAVLAVLVALLTAIGFGRPAVADDTPRAAPAAVPPVLRVGTEGTYAPFSYHDAKTNKLTGFDIDVMNAIGKRLGVRVQYVEIPFDGIFAALQSKRIDVVANEITRNPEREQLYDLSAPYVETTGVVVTRKGNDTIKSLADLKGKRSGQNVSSNWAEVARKAGAKVVGVEDLSQAINSLENGRLDALVNDKLAVRNYLALNPDARIQVVQETEDRGESVLAARKGSGYMPQIDAAIAQLRADGTLKKAYDTYFTAKPKPVTNWQLAKDSFWPMVQAAVKRTIPLAIIAFGVGLVIALFVALARMSSQPWFSAPARLFVSIIRGTPLLVQLFVIFYGLPEIGIKFNSFVAAAIALSLNVAGYAAEVVRAALESIPRGQWEAGSTVGMDYRTTLRRIILPQAARTAVPPLGNIFISTVKDTSLTALILVLEIVRTAQNAAASTQKFFPVYVVAAVIYWVICLALSFLQSRAETRLSRFVIA